MRRNAHLIAVVAALIAILGTMNAIVTRAGALATPSVGNAILASSVVTGASHSCALTTTGGVKCWGSNSDGQLGDGTFTDRSAPVDVSGLTSGVTGLAAGGWHTCAITTGGALKCWGNNDLGQLGDGTTTTHNVPVAVSGLVSGVTAVTAGQIDTCVLTSVGSVQCWGYNGDGELGDGTTTDRAVPGGVSGLTSGVTRLSVGGFHACALASGGAVQCWGDDDFGELGDGSTTSSDVPVAVPALSSGALDVAAGAHHSCAITAAGGVQCWGYNRDGELGDGTGLDQPAPVDVTGLTSGVVDVSAGAFHTCALTTAGGAKCWGDGDDGDLGDGTGATSLVPVDVSGLTSGVAAVSAGGFHSCAVLSSSAVRCWGANDSGQLGDGTKTARLTPVSVNLPSPSTFVLLGTASFYEGDVGPHVVDMPVTLRDAATSTITVGYSVYRDKNGDTATGQGVDFTGRTGTLTFPPTINGRTPTVAYIPITVVGDTASEGNETLSVLLTSVTGPATIQRNYTRATILDDDPQTGLQVTVGNTGEYEGNSVATGATNGLRFHVSLSQPVPAGSPNVVVGYTVTGNSATGCASAAPGCDFVSVTTPASLTFTPGHSDQVVTVPTFADTTREPNETFSVRLVSVTNATISHGLGTGTIINDD